MGDPRRFHLFADMIARVVPNRSSRIADVASGKGILAWSLKERGFTCVTPFEPMPRKGHVRRLGMHVRDFTPSLARGFDVIVGMHPDAATDCILSGAAISGALAIVCPCCVRPNAWTYWGARGNFASWVDHLAARAEEHGLEVRTTSLPMAGRNLVMIAGRAA